eukprot:3863864-Lingulodinium_polyedra.AAC.1
MDSSGATLVAGSSPEATIHPPPLWRPWSPGGRRRCPRWRRKWRASRGNLLRPMRHPSSGPARGADARCQRGVGRRSAGL